MSKEEYRKALEEREEIWRKEQVKFREATEEEIAELKKQGRI